MLQHILYYFLLCISVGIYLSVLNTLRKEILVLLLEILYINFMFFVLGDV